MRRHVTHEGFHSRCEQNLAPFLRRAVIGRNRLDLFRRNSLLSIVRKATQERAQLLQIAGHGHENQSRQFLCVWAHVRGRNGVTQEIGVRRIERGFRGRALEIVLV